MNHDSYTIIYDRIFTGEVIMKNNNSFDMSEVTLDAELFSDLIKLYKVIADGTRLKLLYALSRRSLCVHEIMKVADISQSLASHQLRVLKDNNLAISEKRKNETVYSLADDHIRWLLDIAIAHLTEEIL